MLRGKLDEAFDSSDLEDGLRLSGSLQQVRTACLPSAPVQNLAVGQLELLGSQKHLSAQVDAALIDNLSKDFQATGSLPRHLALEAIPGAGAWLTAPASQGDVEIDEPLYRLCVQRRLRVPIFKGDEVCTFCGSPMDRFGDHALVCCCGGDRTVRHNAVRDQVYSELRAGGVAAEREKAGLLPGRPKEDGLPSPAQARRPADVWIPGCDARLPRAIDFAVTSGLRCPTLGANESDIAAVFADYEAYKCSCQNTQDQCQRQGMAFLPFVLEAHAGGMSPSARRTLDGIAREVAGATNADPAAVALRMAQRISCSLQRESARAILRRRSAVGCTAATASGWDAVPAAETQWQ